MSLADEWLETFRNVLTGPSEYLESEERNEGFGYPLKFALISFVIAAVLNAARSLVLGAAMAPTMESAAMGGASAVLASVMMLVFTPLFGLLGLFIGSGIIHVFVLLLGGGRGYRRTLAASEYATALSPVTALMSFIPVLGAVINFFLGIYGLYIQIRGIQNFHDISHQRAALAVVIPVVIGFILLMVLAMLAAVAFMGSSTGMTPT